MPEKREANSFLLAWTLFEKGSWLGVGVGGGGWGASVEGDL